jgi:uncharacterized membrane protein
MSVSLHALSHFRSFRLFWQGAIAEELHYMFMSFFCLKASRCFGFDCCSFVHEMGQLID